MTPSLSIATSSLGADTAAIAAVSENVANAQTPGYVSETANLATVPGAGGVGDGVQVVDIAQATNALLEANNWQAQGSLASLSSLQAILSSAETLFPIGNLSSATSAPGTTAGSGISSELATYWSSWDAVAQNPSSSAPRLQIIDEARSLTVSLNEASAQLAQVTSNTNAQLATQVSQINSLLGQVAETNQSIAASGGGSQANQLENQLRALIGTLATLAGVDVRMQSDGTATVSIGGVTVVQAATANTLALTTGGTPPRTSVVLGTSPAVVVPLQSGSAAGLLSAINKYLPDYRAQLNTVATALKSTTNNQLAAGYTSSGASGATYPLFVGTGAFGIAVNPAVATNPSLLAASGTSTPQAASNDGSNAQTIAELGTTPIGPDASYRALVQNIGADTQGIDSQVQAQSAVATQAQAALEGVSGVDVTTQLSNLLGLQEDYQASAKLLTIVDSTVQSLLQAVT